MKQNTNNSGFSLPELLMSTAILLTIFAGVMVAILKCVELSDVSHHSSLAVMTVKNKVMDVEDAAFASVKATFHNVTFTAADLNGIGVTYVDDTNPALLEIRTVFTWRERNGRVMGEDKDLDGVLDFGEDLNGDGRLNSMVEVTTYRSDV